MSHVLRVSTAVAIRYYYSKSVFMRHIFSLLVDDAVFRSARQWDSLNECPLPVQYIRLIWDIGLNIGSNKNPYGISKNRLVCFSEHEGGIEHSSSCVCASMMSLWKRSCGSTWTYTPSILTDYFVPRVTTWSFRLKVCPSSTSVWQL